MALCCMSHSPLLNLPGPSPELLDDIERPARAGARVRGRLRSRARRDLLAGPLQRLLLPADAAVLHRHRRDRRRRLRHPRRSAGRPRGDIADATAPQRFSEPVSTWRSRRPWTSTTAPCSRWRALFGDAAVGPVIPIFINSVATPLGPLQTGPGARRRGRELPGAPWANGSWSWDPVACPTIRRCRRWPPHRRPPWPASCAASRCRPEQRAARQSGGDGRRARLRPRRSSPLQPLNPDWDHAFLELLDTNRLADVDGWTNAGSPREAGNSAHEIRTWVAAFAALAAQGRYETQQRYYRAAPELIAGFAIRTAVRAQ